MQAVDVCNHIGECCKRLGEFCKRTVELSSDCGWRCKYLKIFSSILLTYHVKLWLRSRIYLVHNVYSRIPQNTPAPTVVTPATELAPTSRYPAISGLRATTKFRATTVLHAAYNILYQILFCRFAPLATNFVGSYQAGQWAMEQHAVVPLS